MPVELERSRRQAAATECPLSGGDHGGFGRAQQIGDAAVVAAGEISAAGTAQFGSDQLDPGRFPLPRHRESRLASGFGEHGGKRRRRALRQRADRGAVERATTLNDGAPQRFAGAGAGECQFAVDLRRLLADRGPGGQRHLLGGDGIGAQPRHRRLHADRGATGVARELRAGADPFGRRRSRREPDNAGIGGTPPLAQILGQREIERNLRRRSRQLAFGAGEACAAERPDKLRPHVAHAHAAVKADVATAAPGRGERRRDQREPSVKIPAQIALPVQSRTDGAPRRPHARARIVERHRQIGQHERRRARRIAELVERAERQAPVGEGAVETHAFGVDPRHIGTGEAPVEHDLDAARGQVGTRGIADDDVGQPLGAETDPFDRVARGHPALVELVANEAVGDRRAREPQARRDRDQCPARDPALAEPGPRCRICGDRLVHARDRDEKVADRETGDDVMRSYSNLARSPSPVCPSCQQRRNSRFAARYCTASKQKRFYDR